MADVCNHLVWSENPLSSSGVWSVAEWNLLSSFSPIPAPSPHGLSQHSQHFLAGYVGVHCCSCHSLKHLNLKHPFAETGKSTVHDFASTYPNSAVEEGIIILSLTSIHQYSQYNIYGFLSSNTGAVVMGNPNSLTADVRRGRIGTIVFCSTFWAFWTFMVLYLEK